MAKKILGAAALTAALAGGGALGALLGTPALTAAQEEPATTTAPEENEAPAEHHKVNCDDGAGHGGRAFGIAGSVAAEALGMTEEQLRDALRGGSSIASIAEERGVDLQTVVDALVAEATARIDERVAEGDLDAANAEEKKADLAERVQAFVEREGGLRFGGPRGGRMR